MNQTMKANSKKKGTLSSLLKQANSGSALNVKPIDLTLIDLDPEQPRKKISEENLAELAASLLALGQIQPIVVRENTESKGRYIVVVGERRFRASVLNKSNTISALIKDDLPADKLRLIQVAENMSRDELSPSEIVDSVISLSKTYGLSRAEIGDAIGCSKSRISEYMTIADAPSFIRTYLDDGAKLRPVVELCRLHKMDSEFIESHCENVSSNDITLPFTSSLKSQLEQLNVDESETNADANTDNQVDIEEQIDAEKQIDAEEQIDLSGVNGAFSTRSASKAIIRVKTPIGYGVIAMVYLPSEPDTIAVSFETGAIINVLIADVTIVGYE
jgi:ParB family chromosome partitioning protein